MLAGFHHLPLRTSIRISTDWSNDRFRFCINFPQHQCNVSFPHQTFAKVTRQNGERARSLGDDHQPRGLPIEPVNNSWPYRRVRINLVSWSQGFDSPAARFNCRLVEMISKRIGERAGLYSTRGMYKHPGWLYDDGDLIVFVDALDRDRFGRHRCGNVVVDTDF